MEKFRYEIRSDNSESIKVVEINSGEIFSHSCTVKGAVIGALAVGIPLKTIDYNGHWVPIRECLEAVR